MSSNWILPVWNHRRRMSAVWKAVSCAALDGRAAGWRRCSIRRRSLRPLLEEARCMDTTTRIRVLVVDDSVSYGSMIKRALEAISGVTVIGRATNGRDG